MYETRSIIFLEEKLTPKIDGNSSNITSNITETLHVHKTFDYNQTKFEIVSFIEYRFNESFLVIQVNEQFSKFQKYKFEGNYDQIVQYDTEWSLF